MRWVGRMRRAGVTLFRRRRETERLDAEMRFHLERQTEENVRKGMDPEEARKAALRAFGNPTLLRDEARANWWWGGMETLLRDVRYGMRTLRRSPGFALMAVVVIALGLGATTSLFTIVRSVLLKPLPFRDPQNLVMVYERFRAATGPGDHFNVVAPGDFYAWRGKTHGFAEMAAWRDWKFNLSGARGELPEGVEAAAGSYNLFSVLGVQPALGRSFTAEEDRVGGDTAMLTWSFFERRFAGNPAIVGQQIWLDAKPYTVVGVLPRSFAYPSAHVQLWVPYASVATAEQLARPDNHQSYVVARLKPGVSRAAATAQVDALQYQIYQQNLGKPVAEDAVSRPMIEDVVHDVKTPLTVLLCAVGCMLLIACLNVSNLLVARGAARRKEVAVRSALGGNRLALIREQMTESVLICLAGGALGILLSVATTHWLAGHWRDLPRAEEIHVDGVVLLFAVGVTFAAALLSGLLPAISSTGTSVLAALQDASRSIGGSQSRAALRTTLLTAEIALTVLLLVGAGLLFKSFLQLRGTDVGIKTDHVLTMSYSLPEKQYSKPEQIVAFHEQLLARVRRLPGVLGAGLVTVPPGGGWGGDEVFTIPEHPPVRTVLQNDTLDRMADPGYFHALGIPLLSGRFFTDQDRLDRSQYVIVSKRLADQYFPHESPLGKHLRIDFDHQPKTYEIVGVVGNTLHYVDQPTKATTYFPAFTGLAGHEMSLVVRTAGDPQAMAIPIQKQIAALDPGLPVTDVMTMQQLIGQSTATAAFSATLVVAFAGLSLLLAAVGLFGVLSYLVTQRVTEIGIRMALGAQRGEVLRLVMLDGLRPVLLGLLLGGLAGGFVGVLIRSQLYGTRAVDPMVFAGMVACLLVTAMVACAVPALRALRIEPMQALRVE